ncbi:MAG: gamma-glutamyltransferase [Chloroflexi bacterium]|jgi:gamma-glutamyltranspeptidase / glutathione hydrolase|nr:gamma-glutamyltransferase [Chloroflexota bacterium]MBT6682224.1 gamma-glutamyltransferase [Chloroflexota bacterium]
MYTTRPVLASEEIRTRMGMVVAQHPLGTEIGLEVLQKGGNAVDAAVTTAFAMGVLQPLMNGIGGGGLITVHMAAGGGGAIDYGMQAPGRATTDEFPLEGGMESMDAGSSRYSRNYAWPKVKDDMLSSGYKSIAIPGTVAGLSRALDEWGTISLSDALQPAIKLAEDGFAVGAQFTLSTVARRDLFLRFPATTEIYYPGGYPIPVGGKLIQKEHAESLRVLAAGGPDAFYRGEIAQKISADVQANGGLLDVNDFAQYTPFLHRHGKLGEYRGYEIMGLPGPTSGPTVMEILNILSTFELTGTNHGDPATLHIIAEAIKLAASDRFTWMGDPEKTGAPIGALTVPEYGAERAKSISRQAAGPAEAGNPWPFEGREKPADFPGPAGAAADDGTTHISVVDKDRNAVALTQTNLAYSGVVNPGVGVMMNNGIGWSCPLPGTVNTIAPHARALNNMTPIVLLKDGELAGALGASGGRRIWTSVLQSLVHYIDQGMSLQEAVQAPRIHVEDDDVMIDGLFEYDTINGLKSRGHKVTIVNPRYDYAPYAEPNGIAVDGSDLRSAVYPVAKLTMAAGY